MTEPLQVAQNWVDAPTDRTPAANARLEVPAQFAEMLEDYEIVDEIARGGMGVVYRARQRSLNRIVALKVLLARDALTDEDRASLRHEAQSAAQLRHPTIVAIHDCGESAGVPYFSMELIAGQSLAQRLASGPLAANEAAALIRQVADGVQHAHDRQILHRDLKPANILLDEFGLPHVTDFGIACQASDATGGGERPPFGTPGYMAPEQVEGRASTTAVDVYALGAVLYAAVTGRAPFFAATPIETLVQVVEREPAAPRTLNAAVPADLESIVMKCLRKSPRERFATARELAADLDRFLRGEAVHARRGDGVYYTLRWLRRNLVLAGVSGAVALLLLVFSTVMAIAYRTELARRTVLERELVEEQSRTAVAQEQLRRQTSLANELRLRLQTPATIEPTLPKDAPP